MPLINKLTKDFIDKIIIEFEKQDNKEKINDKLIHPIMFYISSYISMRIYPFLIMGSIIFFLTFLFVIIILIVLIYKLFR